MPESSDICQYRMIEYKGGQITVAQCGAPATVYAAGALSASSMKECLCPRHSGARASHYVSKEMDEIDMMVRHARTDVPAT